MKLLPQKLPVDIASFETMRSENYLYVDKTQHIYRMVTEGRYYFLSRPRRFGKSLLVSTLACLFQGRKDLFEGLWIAEQSDWEWREHPVIVLDFNDIPGENSDELKLSLSFRLKTIAREHGIALEAPSPGLLLSELISRLHEKTQQPVLVLIDEYDKRIIEHLGQGEQGLERAKANREALKSVFGILKGQAVTSKLRLVFLTGVSRFSKVSLFSDLNNLQDISMSERYACMLGYSKEELSAYFPEYITPLAEELGWSHSQVFEALARKYNGYRFSHGSTFVYNPFSVLNALHNRKLGNYWFESATPTFLVNYLKHTQYNLPEIEGLQLSQAIFSNFELENLRPEALLFQTGYLTIQDVQDEVYTLNYPNQEVKHAFSEALLLSLAESAGAEISSQVLKLSGDLAREDFESFFQSMRTIFASIPYDIQSKRDEAYYHTLFYLMMTASGVNIQSSILTCAGRIDVVVQLSQKTYIIEFKCNQSAKAALQQIRVKRYAEKYRSADMRIFLIGINFDTEKRNLQDWIVEAEETT